MRAILASGTRNLSVLQCGLLHTGRAVIGRTSGSQSFGRDQIKQLFESLSQETHTALSPSALFFQLSLPTTTVITVLTLRKQLFESLSQEAPLHGIASLSHHCFTTLPHSTHCLSSCLSHCLNAPLLASTASLRHLLSHAIVSLRCRTAQHLTVVTVLFPTVCHCYHHTCAAHSARFHTALSRYLTVAILLSGYFIAATLLSHAG